MDNEKFIERCKIMVEQRILNKLMDDGNSPEFDVIIVWSCKTLQNNKAILSATVKDAPLYEITHNGDKGETYIDTYIKESNECIKM